MQYIFYVCVLIVLSYLAYRVFENLVIWMDNNIGRPLAKVDREIMKEKMKEKINHGGKNE